MKTEDIMFHQKRKTNKPLTEKRRRERINNSLMQLKTLVLRGTNKENQNKLEKADIMEMTVRYIEDQQQRQISQDDENSQLAMHYFNKGYTTCVNEVFKSLNDSWISNDIISCVSNHLTTSLYSCLSGFYQHEVSSSSFTHIPDTSRPQSRVSDNRMPTSTPHNLSATDESMRYQLSPTNSIFSSSPRGNLAHSDWSTVNSSTSPSASSGNIDSGLDCSPSPTRPREELGLHGAVWRPW